MASVADLVEPVLRGEGADPADLDRARELADAGAVRLTVFTPLVVEGVVDGVAVRLEATGDTLSTVPASWTKELLAAALVLWRAAPRRR